MNAGSLISPAVVDRLGWVLIHSLWQGTAVAGLLAIVLLFSRRRSPQLHLARWAACWPSSGSWSAPMILAPPVPAAAGPAAAMRPGLPPIANLHGPRAFAQMPSVPAPAAATGLSTLTWSKWLEPLMPWLVGLWACGVLALSTWHAGGWVAAQRMRSWVFRRFAAS